MASRYKEEYESEMAFMEEIIKHDPELQNAHPETLTRMRLDASRGNANIAMLFEDLVARVGKFDRSPEMVGDDYLHGQGDAKTITLGDNNRFSQKDIQQGSSDKTSCYATIRGIENKQGPLRIMAYITRTKKVQYFFLPTEIWKSWVNKSGTGIKINYNATEKTLGRIEQYSRDFTGVCKPETVTKGQDSVKTPKEKHDIVFDKLFT